MQNSSPPSAIGTARLEDARRGDLTADLFQSSNSKNHWNILELVSFRFAAFYFGVFNFDYAVGWVCSVISHYVPSAMEISKAYSAGWHILIVWVAQNIFHFRRDLEDCGWEASDLAHGWLRTACILALAVAGTLLWSMLDRKRREYDTLNEWFRLSLRLALSSWLMSYGTSKLFPDQFPPVRPFSYMQRVADLNRMSLLWIFIGSSELYQMFGGLAELIPAFLLWFRRFTLLGSILSAAVMLNVFLMNICYDLPVKQFSLHLLLMSLVLIAPDLRRLLNFFVLNRTTPQQVYPVFSNKKWIHTFALFLPALVVGECLTAKIPAEIVRYTSIRKTPPLFGVWRVVEFSLDKNPIPASAPSNERWTAVVFDFPGRLEIRRGEKCDWLSCWFSNDQKRITIGEESRGDGTDSNIWAHLAEKDLPKLIKKDVLQIEKIADRSIVIKGLFQKHELEAKLRKVPDEQLPLNQKMLWIRD